MWTNGDPARILALAGVRCPSLTSGMIWRSVLLLGKRTIKKYQRTHNLGIAA